MRSVTKANIYSYSIALVSLLAMCGSCLLVLLTLSAQKQDKTSIVFVGDILLDRGVLETINVRGVDALFTSTTTQFFTTKDVVIGNLECPTTEIQEPLFKKFCFRASPKYIPVLRKHGITHLTMANNHTMDQGRDGMKDTYRNIKKHGIVPLGYGTSMRKACSPQLIAKHPRPVYVFSSVLVTSENWVQLEEQSSICEYKIPRLAKEIQEFKKQHTNAVIFVQLHWGAEHRTTPTFDQVRDARMLIDAGVDGIIGHHPHVIQPPQEYKGKPIYFSIGNFIFDQKKPMNKKAIAVEWIITKNAIEHKSHPLDIRNNIPHFQFEYSIPNAF